MSGRPTKTTEESIEHLKQFIINKTGLPCNSFHDIQLLQYQIKRDINECLSLQTLRRFFGLIKNNFRPSFATLNILSRFVGFHTLDEFEMLYHHSLPPSQKEPLPVSTFLMTLFSDVKFQTRQESGLLNVTRNVCKIIEANPSIAKDIYSFMATCKYGREYFFEHFVNIDALNEHYGDGLYYYLLHAKYRDQIFFGCTLLCKRYLLTRHRELFGQYYSKVMAYPLSEVKNFHPYLIGSYYAVKLYNNILHDHNLLIADEALQQFAVLPQNEAMFGAFPWAEYVLGDALILADEYYQAWKVFEAGAGYFKHTPDLDEGFETQYELLHLYAGFFAGMIPEKKAIAQLKIINVKPLFFLSKKYFSFFLLILNKTLLPRTETKNFSLQIKKLLEETGFKHFEKAVERLVS